MPCSPAFASVGAPADAGAATALTGGLISVLPRSSARLIAPDDVSASRQPVGHDLDDVVAVVPGQVVADAHVERGGVGEVQRDQGEVALLDEHGVDAGVA